MTAATPRHPGDLVVDVAVVGGGLAGLATATHLARRRHGVVCLEPRSWPRPAVGESLEFSAPRLLAELGIDLDRSVEHGQLFPKTSVAITGDDTAFTVWPPAWFGRPPIWCSGLTYHTDRTELDHQLMQLAAAHGVEILPERVTKLDHEHDVVKALHTDRGTRIRADWYVDATGHACRLFGRTLGLDIEPLGPSRSAYWARFDVGPEGHATHLYFPATDADELTWVWEIPLNAGEVSIGAVMSTTERAALRRLGMRPAEIFGHQLATIPRLRRIVDGAPAVELHATTYTPYRHRNTLGPNWVLVGDAAAMVDPLTSNGVTSALRHAEQAARTVGDAFDRRKLSRRHAWAYRNTAPATVITLDHAIEAFVYHPTLRRRLGLRWAVSLYAATGVATNALYARINPSTVLRSVGCAALMAISRLWIRGASATLRGVARLRPGHITRRGAEPHRPTARASVPTVRRERPQHHTRPSSRPLNVDAARRVPTEDTVSS